MRSLLALRLGHFDVFFRPCTSISSFPWSNSVLGGCLVLGLELGLVVLGTR